MFIPEFQDPSFFNGVKPSTGEREFFKPGYYRVHVTGGEIVATKNEDINTHAQFVVELTGLEGDGKDIKINARFNLRNPNKQAVDIGKSEMLALFNAMGASAPKNSISELFGKPFIVKIKNGQPNDRGRVFPEVSAFYPNAFVPPFMGVEPGYVAPQPIPAAAQRPAAATYTPPAAYPASAPSDDDIPF